MIDHSNLFILANTLKNHIEIVFSSPSPNLSHHELIRQIAEYVEAVVPTLDVSQAIEAENAGLRVMLKDILSRYEYTCFGDEGVEGFRSGEIEDDIFFPSGEESDADAIDEARAYLKSTEKK